MLQLRIDSSDDLNGTWSRANHRNSFVFQVDARVPCSRMQHWSFEAFSPWDVRPLPLTINLLAPASKASWRTSLEYTTRIEQNIALIMYDICRVITALDINRPFLILLVPPSSDYLMAKFYVFHQTILFSQVLQILQDIGRRRVTTRISETSGRCSWGGLTTMSNGLMAPSWTDRPRPGCRRHNLWWILSVHSYSICHLSKAQTGTYSQTYFTWLIRARPGWKSSYHVPPISSFFS